MGLFKRITIANVGDVEIYEPSGLTSTRRVKVCVFAHGQNGDMFNGVANSMYNEGLPYHLKNSNFEPDCLVVMPYGTTNNGWNNYNGFWNRVWAWIQANYNVHLGHVCYASYSLGGINAMKEIVYTDSVFRAAITHTLMVCGFPSSGEYAQMYSYVPKANFYLVAAQNDGVLDSNGDARGFESYLSGKVRNNIKYILDTTRNHFTTPAHLPYWEEGLLFAGIDRVANRVTVANKKKTFGLVGSPNDFYNIQSTDPNGQLATGWAARMPYISKLSLYLTRNLFLFRSENGGFVQTNSFGINRMISLMRAANPSIIIEFRLMGLDYKELVTYPENLRRGDYNMVEAPYQANRELPASYEGFAQDGLLLWQQVIAGKESYVWLKDGNEPDIQQGFVTNRDYMPPKQAAARHVRLSQVIRAQYPNAKISGPGIYSNLAYINTYFQEIQNFGGVLPDRMTYHRYPVNYSVGKYEDPDSGLYRADVKSVRDGIRAWSNTIHISCDEYGTDSQRSTASNKAAPFEAWRGYKIARMAEVLYQTGYDSGSVYAAIDETPPDQQGGANDTSSGDVDENNANKSSYNERVASYNETDGAAVDNPPTVQVTFPSSVNEGAPFSVTVQGFDSDGTAVTTTLQRISGPAITLGTTSGGSSFTSTQNAPLVSADSPLVLRGTATSNGLTATQDVTIQILNVDGNPTVAISASPTSVREGQPFQLIVTGSDPDNDPLQFTLSQVSGPATTLGQTTATAGFTSTQNAPQVSANANAVFRATLVANGKTVTADVTVAYVNNLPPVVTAGTDQSYTLLENETGHVFAITSSTTDDFGTPTKAWSFSQGSGTFASQADNTNTSSLPAGTYRVRRTGTDAEGLQGFAETMLTVIPYNAPPDTTPPVVNAGNDQTVNEGDTVTISSTESDNVGIASGVWSQQSGPAVSFANINAALTTFVAPQVTGSQVAVLRRTVTDAAGNSAYSEVAITILDTTPPPNNAPTGTAGQSETFKKPAVGHLRGSGTDPDNDPLTFKWVVKSGNGISIANDTLPQTTFNYPNIDQIAVFELTIKDGRGGVVKYEVAHTLQKADVTNQPPAVADIAPTEVVLPNTNVVLGVIANSPTEPISFNWVPLGGPDTPVLTNPDSQYPSVNFDPLQSGDYDFEVTVTGQNSGLQSKRIARVTLRPPLIPEPQVPTGYGPRYRITYTTPQGKKSSVFFYKRGFSGAAEDIADLISADIDQSSSDEGFFTPIIATKLSVKFYGTPEITGDEFFSGDDKLFFVRAEIDFLPVFMGWVVPDVGGGYYNRNRPAVSVNAIDGLSLLKAELFEQDGGERYKGRVSAVFLVKNCLDRLGYGAPFSFLTPLFEDHLMDDRMHQWEKVMLETDNYYDTDNSPKDCYTILEMFCRSFGFTLFKDGYIFKFVCVEGLDRLDVLDDISLYEYNANGVLNPPAKTNYPKTIAIGPGKTEVFNPPAQLRKNRPYNIVDGKTSFDKTVNLYDNSDFESGATEGGLPPGWSKVVNDTDATLRSVGIAAYSGTWVFRIKGGDGRISRGSGDNAREFGYVQSPAIEIYRNDLKGKISFQYFQDKPSNVSVVSIITSYMIIYQDGNGQNTRYYNKDTGNWVDAQRVNEAKGTIGEWNVESVETSTFPGAGIFFVAFRQTTYVQTGGPTGTTVNDNREGNAFTYLDDLFLSFSDGSNPKDEIVGEINRYMNQSKLFKTSIKQVQLDQYTWERNKYVTGAVTVRVNGSDIAATNWRILPYATPVQPLYLQKIVTEIYLRSALVPQTVFDGDILSDTAAMYSLYTIEGQDGIFWPVSIKANLAKGQRSILLIQVLPQFSGNFSFRYLPQYREPSRKNI